jgi:hypothetical protein
MVVSVPEEMRTSHLRHKIQNRWCFSRLLCSKVLNNTISEPTSLHCYLNPLRSRSLFYCAVSQTQ